MDKHNSKNYKTLIDFATFLRENCDKLFDKDSKLSVNVDQLVILQDYLQALYTVSKQPPTTSNNEFQSSKSDQNKRILNANNNSSRVNSKEFLLLYKSNQLHFIQDFLFKITNVKITAAKATNPIKDMINLSIFGSLTFLEIRNCPLANITDLQNLRNQLECLICINCISKVQDLLHLCGADQSLPITWPKLHTLNLSYNQLNKLDNSFRLATSIELLDLSHNNIEDCSENLQNLKKLKRLNLSFNKLRSIPSICDENATNTELKILDLSYNNIEKLNKENISKLTSVEDLNLKSNLINDLIELNHLRLMSNIKQICVDLNPISLNPSCEFIVKEIISIVNLKKELKGKSSSNSSNKTRNNFSYVPSTATKSIPVQPKTQSDRLNSSVLSAPNKLFLNDSNIQSHKQSNKSFDKKKLKPNIVLIEPENSPHELINENESLSNTDSIEINPNKAIGDLIADIYSTSVGTQYDPNKLQLEIENLKKMRQSYGTDWLLSTPSLINNSNINKSNNNIKIANKLKQTNNNQIKDDCNVEQIIESYAVYRHEIDIKNENNMDNADYLNTITCILSLSEKCLVEMDETNTVLKSANQISDLNEIKLFTIKNQIQINFMSQNESNRNNLLDVYEFENDRELNNFVECLHKILFNEHNIVKCNLLYCYWCKEFVKKSKFKLDNSNDGIEELNKIEDNSNITCTKCSRYLIKNNRVQLVKEDNDEPESKTTNLVSSTPNHKIKSSNQDSTDTSQLSQSFGGTLTLKDVLRGFKVANEELSSSPDNENNNNAPINTVDNVSLSKSLSSTHSTESEQLTTSKSKEIDASLDERLNIMPSGNNQITKAKLEEINQQSKRMNNNLKLYLIINVLNEINEANSKEMLIESKDMIDETLVCVFKMNHVFMNRLNDKPSVTTSKNTNLISNLSIGNCLCMFTNKSIILFRIINQDLYNRNIEFEKCLRKEIIISINKIETIEIGMGQHFLVIEEAIDNDKADYSEVKNCFKFITFDFYQSQALLNILLKIINESKNVTLLKQIRKKNELTNKNLSDIMLQHIFLSSAIKSKIEESSLSSFISFYAFVEDFKLNQNEPSSTFVINSINLFLFNDELLIIVEENLAYVADSTDTNQFKFVQAANISDIVHLRLFREEEKRIEISFLDERNNSKQINWLFALNQETLLSQLINQIKVIWEKIFFVELPINF